MPSTLAPSRCGHIVPTGCSMHPRWGMSLPPKAATVASAMHERHLTIVDAAVPAVVAAVIVVGEGLHGGSAAHPAAQALGIGAALSLAARRRWPGWTFAVCLALVIVQFHMDRAAASVAVVAPAVALYSVALTRGRRQQIAAAVVAIAAVIAADVAHPGRPTLGQTLAHVLLVALPLLTAEVIRTHRANLGLLVERLELAERNRAQEADRRAEHERVRIARELHDVVAHTLTEINVTAAAAAERAEDDDHRGVLEQIERTSHDAIGELRAILGVLRDPEPGNAPNSPAPGIDDIRDLVDRVRGAGLDVRLDIDGRRPERMSDAASLAAFRIIQESLTNVRRHASGAGATVMMRFGASALSLTVDNDRGNDNPHHNGRVGVGITGMRERVNAIGGHVSAGSNASGFQVHAEIPYEAAR
jgi:signal transduction histidine kinase